MLYAVSVETSRAIRHGRMRRRERVYVDARDVDEARDLALQRFRHVPRDAPDRPRIAIGAVRAVSLERPRSQRVAPTPPRVAPSPPSPPPPPPSPKPTKPRRPKRRQRKRGASSR